MARLLWFCAQSLLFAIALGSAAAYWQAQEMQALKPVAPHPSYIGVQIEAAALPVEDSAVVANALGAPRLSPAMAPGVNWGSEVVVAQAGTMRPALKGESTWAAANDICISHGGRLPSAAELQRLWTQHTEKRPRNAELCQKHGWPLYKLCGGQGGTQGEAWASEQVKNGTHASVDLFTGLRRERSDAVKLHLVCLLD